MFIIYVTDLSTKKNVNTGVYIFTKIENTDNWKQKKKFSFFISGIPNFSDIGSFRKGSMFRRSIPLTKISQYQNGQANA